MRLAHAAIVTAFLTGGIRVGAAADVRRRGELVNGLHPAPPMQPGRRHIGRNDACYCGSGQKFKNCHLNPVPVEAIINNDQEIPF